MHYLLPLIFFSRKKKTENIFAHWSGFLETLNNFWTEKGFCFPKIQRSRSDMHSDKRFYFIGPTLQHYPYILITSLHPEGRIIKFTRIPKTVSLQNGTSVTFIRCLWTCPAILKRFGGDDSASFLKLHRNNLLNNKISKFIIFFQKKYNSLFLVTWFDFWNFWIFWQRQYIFQKVRKKNTKRSRYSMQLQKVFLRHVRSFLPVKNILWQKKS